MTRVQPVGRDTSEVQGYGNRPRLKVVDESVDMPAAVTTRLLRIEEAAGWLGLSRRKTYELLSRGEIQSVYIGRSRRITFAALQHFVDGLSHHRG